MKLEKIQRRLPFKCKVWVFENVMEICDVKKR
jgi:hypothetical protein